MATTLNNVSLADPYDVSISREMIGGVKESANGTRILDYFSTTLKRKVVMRWRLLTETQRNTIITNTQACISQSRILVLPDGTYFYVFFDPERQPTETMVNRGVGGIHYNLEVAFSEV